MSNDLIYGIYYDNHYNNKKMTKTIYQNKMTKSIWMKKFIWNALNYHKESTVLKKWVYSLKT